MPEKEEPPTEEELEAITSIINIIRINQGASGVYIKANKIEAVPILRAHVKKEVEKACPKKAEPKCIHCGMTAKQSRGQTKTHICEAPVATIKDIKVIGYA